MIPLFVILACLLLMPIQMRQNNMVRAAALGFLIMAALGALLR